MGSASVTTPGCDPRTISRSNGKVQVYDPASVDRLIEQYCPHCHQTIVPKWDHWHTLGWLLARVEELHYPFYNSYMEPLPFGSLCDGMFKIVQGKIPPKGKCKTHSGKWIGYRQHEIILKANTIPEFFAYKRRAYEDYGNIALIAGMSTDFQPEGH